MKFAQQLAAAERRMQEAGDFDARWVQVRAELPEGFSISRLADGQARLSYSKWVPDAGGGRLFVTTPVVECIEWAVQVLGMLCFCKVLRLKGLPLTLAVQIFRVCEPLKG
ncbi:MAG: hypothetical protein HC800_20495 [Phormidesmis sp. RL_2_1]|nr:hypothetical protein [Phormidesmis sp. RL_2_1]